jgi:hypothetical protein
VVSSSFSFLQHHLLAHTGGAQQPEQLISWGGILRPGHGPQEGLQHAPLGDPLGVTGRPVQAKRPAEHHTKRA